MVGEKQAMTADTGQLSTEQMTLQQTIMKESKMNNRLSLQNEELLWKLHNGDLWPPRNMPPPPVLPVLPQLQLHLQPLAVLQLAPPLQGASQEKYKHRPEDNFSTNMPDELPKNMKLTALSIIRPWSKHEVLEKELKSSHTEKVESLKRHYKTSFEELRKSHDQERQTLDQSRKQTEATLCDSHALYLQQELESLKVVLDLKNTDLHQQNKKLMDLKTLRETNMNSEGCLKKTPQENEDLRARQPCTDVNAETPVPAHDGLLITQELSSPALECHWASRAGCLFSHTHGITIPTPRILMEKPRKLGGKLVSEILS
ncbi:hypothetical protein AAFF_G00380020 [Aldrovandia affinis]|uniref:Uncharacterized protein n=1 Tax=Aldrovandia affinis TaxID=143900 RepID=A0AAD7X0P2_9TELE|nr:hypothetical protein AAFF_G00380020 [Aldrovandia affinis]